MDFITSDKINNLQKNVFAKIENEELSKDGIKEDLIIFNTS
ncbi:MAG: hypothetical protein ABI675_22715 [Chitinophagaceae bacterium]